jgi:hypothetical protein
MDADFINEYIGKLTAVLHDTVSKNVLLETRLALLEKSCNAIQVEHEKALLELERLKKKPLKQNSTDF